jgi:glucose-1-phosphate thymidylyltransferase
MSGIKKGIILAGGNGTRLYPTTLTTCKQLLPVYDKPMVYYPLSTLMLMGIRNILLISTPEDTPRFESLLGSGKKLGLEISYKVQPKPEGIAQALIIGEKFIGNDNIALILGDNIFYGVSDFRKYAFEFESGAAIFCYYVKNPERYGVVEFDSQNKALTIEEKPQYPKSHFAVTGLYIYDSNSVSIAGNLKPSARGELEITDVNQAYLKQGQLKTIKLGRGIAWLDTGTHESILEAGNFIATIEKRQGQKIACLEEIAYRMGFIDRQQMQKIIESTENDNYRQYLINTANEVEGG